MTGEYREIKIKSPFKIFSAIMDCLVNPLQEKLEDWKKTLVNLDKDHSRGISCVF